MPTGITSDIANGKTVSVNDFILECARQFGGLMHMRDAPPRTPIKLREWDKDYYDRRLDTATEELNRFSKMSPEEAQRLVDEHHKEELERYRTKLKDKAELEKKYMKMMRQVAAWEPPTEEHHKLKEFAINQLKESVKWDCSTSYMTEPKKLSAAEYIEMKISSAKRDIEIITKSRQDEKKRVDDNNKWVTDLLDSLGVSLDE